MSKEIGQLNIVGIGPGNLELIAPMARRAIEEAELVVGYEGYLALVAPLCNDKEVLGSGMTAEIKRATLAVEAALAGRKVALISSGDAGIYAMGSLAMELLEKQGWTRAHPTQVSIIPGITAANSCASLVGTPLGHDSCTISLSDLLTPLALILKRVEAAASADFAITFYNARSKRRQDQIVQARDILLKYQKATTPVAIVEHAYRDGQRIIISDLENFLQHDFSMNAAVIVGNSSSYQFEGLIVTPRGYTKKYDLDDGALQSGQKRGRALRTEPNQQKKEGEPV